MRRRFCLESVVKVTNTVIAYILYFESMKSGWEKEANEWFEEWYRLFLTLNSKERTAYASIKVADIVDKETIKFLSYRDGGNLYE